MKEKLKNIESSYEDLIDEDGEVRTPSDFSKIKFMRVKDVFPELAEYSRQRKAGRPPVEAPKKSKTFKLSQDVIEAIVQSGKGYNARVEKVLRESLAAGKI
ncbi:MAG: BrnA antitoxin family protein [Pseudomonadota bacterium]